MELTDGHKTVIAMEHQPIPCLNTKLKPGIKVLLIGPIKVINKVLFLGPKNINLIGGEVDTLAIENAYENVLLRHLGKPLTETPLTTYEEPTVEEKPEVRNAI
jgi:RecQ-mediated genome instability protein 1